MPKSREVNAYNREAAAAHSESTCTVKNEDDDEMILPLDVSGERKKDNTCTMKQEEEKDCSLTIKHEEENYSLLIKYAEENDLYTVKNEEKDDNVIYIVEETDGFKPGEEGRVESDKLKTSSQHKNMASHVDDQLPIVEVRKRPALWNNSSENQKNEIKKSKTREEVCQSFCKNFEEKTMTEENQLGHMMNLDFFYGTRHKNLQPVVPNNAEDSDDGLDDDDDVDDPDYDPRTGGNDATESDDNEGDDHQEGSAPTQQPTQPRAKKRKVGRTNIVPVDPSPEDPNESTSRERQWRKRDIDNQYPPEVEFTKPDSLQTPFHYFCQFFTPEMVSHISHNTNLYSVQELTNSIQTDDNEIQMFLAVLLYMGVCHLPAVDDYWSVHLRYSLVADLMSAKRFKCLKRYVHFSDNNDENQNNEDKFRKIRPLFEMFREQCKKVTGSTHQSVDEVMVPYKGTRAGKLKQYVKNKPHKYGFKIFCRSSSSGIIHDLLLYQGKTTFCTEGLEENEKDLLLGEKVMLVLNRSVSDPQSTVVFCDNFFTSYKLIKLLESKIGIKTLGTVRQHRNGGARLVPDKVLAKKDRGEYDFSSSENVIAVKWNDNKIVQLLSNAVGVEPVGSCKRYDKELKCKVDIPCPSIVLTYNKHMGGIDLSDMLMALYKTPLRSHRWYLPLFAYILDVSVSNAWLLCKREATMLNEKVMPLKNFRCEIASTLVKVNKKVSVGRPLSRSSTPGKGNTKQKRAQKRAPSADIRHDCIDHWPIPMGSEALSRGRCAHCPKGVSGFKCTKCDVFLCLKNKQMCFVEYHKK